MAGSIALSTSIALHIASCSSVVALAEVLALGLEGGVIRRSLIKTPTTSSLTSTRARPSANVNKHPSPDSNSSPHPLRRRKLYCSSSQLRHLPLIRLPFDLCHDFYQVRDSPVLSSSVQPPGHCTHDDGPPAIHRDDN
ncbi:hypothetical protein IWX48DRAFT_253065 [Phyllosticta citricarpa]